jgi:dihydroneopterin aldolase
LKKPGKPKGTGKARATYHVLVRDLLMPASIGVYRHEHDAPQRVRVNLDLTVRPGVGDLDDDLDNVVCYETIVVAIRTIVARGHINLVESLAEEIAAACLADRRVELARVRVEKLDVFADTASVGVEIERGR